MDFLIEFVILSGVFFIPVLMCSLSSKLKSWYVDLLVWFVLWFVWKGFLDLFINVTNQGG